MVRAGGRKDGVGGIFSLGLKIAQMTSTYIAIARTASLQGRLGNVVLSPGGGAHLGEFLAVCIYSFSKAFDTHSVLGVGTTVMKRIDKLPSLGN